VTEPKKAVFLSYASEDSAAAERICVSLRAAGIEVWFDMSELRGGDAWDRQITLQIRECALFIAVISAGTDARDEGYFRREWRLAVDRTRDLADDKAFLLPVVVDRTTDASARVPDKFREVQWTPLPAGETPPAFVERVKRLLSPRDRAAATPVRPLTPTVHSVACGHDAIPEKSIAVLPFLDMSAKKDQEYFSDGLAEALIDVLTQMRDLRVPARTSSFSFKGKSDEIASIAKKLRVAHILEGSVRKSGDTIRVTAHLIRAENGYHLWSKTFDRDLKDIFKVQDEIAGVVVEELKAKLLPPEGVVNRHRTASTQAYEKYLLGIQFYNRNTVDGYARATNALEQAIALNPDYASAYAVLAMAKSALADIGKDSLQASADAMVAADRAVALAPGLVEAYYARGYARVRAWDWTGAQSDLEKAIELDPNDGASQRNHGYLLVALGRLNEAIVAARRAVELEPLGLGNWIALGISQYGARQYAAGREAFMGALEISSESATARLFLAMIDLIDGQADAALRTNRQQHVDKWRLQILAMTEHSLGHPEEAQKVLDKLIADHGENSAYVVANVYAWCGKTDKAFEWLERAYRQHSTGLWGIKFHYWNNQICSDPRYKALLRKMMLPE
jgi:TolB-like protein/Tfp pilus assembly protein PilF